jgi:phosphoribosylanthranilate isomerase
VTRVKICGVTSVDDARASIDAGADSLGVNFVSTVRRVDVETARAIVRAVGGQTLVVGVVAGMTVPEMRALREATGIGCLQLHGDETEGDVAGLLPHAYKAVRVEAAGDVARARTMPGDYVLVDAKVDGLLGGTGHAFDWSLVVDLARTRKLVLAGGLTPANVARAIRTVGPWCVDVASGVETTVARKDPAKLRAFIDAVRGEDRVQDRENRS